MIQKTRNRSARSGEFVGDKEAAAKPAETVKEKVGDSKLEARVSRIERAIAEFSGPLARIFERL